jgi:hypothetical protein
VMACQVFVFRSATGMPRGETTARSAVSNAYKGSATAFFDTPTESTGRVELTASSADRDLSTQRNISSTENEAVLQLRGNVEVMMCSPGGHGCDNGAMVLHADVVDYNEKTHEIDAHSDVHIDPYRSQPQNTIIPR